MRELGRKKFRSFTARPRTVYDTYYSFDLERSVPNFFIPPLGRDIRVTNLSGEPICLGRRAAGRGRYRLVYKKITIAEQHLHAYALLDQSFEILEKVGALLF